MVLGPAAEVRAFARAATDATNVSWRPGRSHRIYALRRVTPAPPTTGEWRAARAEDTEVLARWMRAFMEESGEPREPEAVFGERTARRIAEGSMYVWCDGGVAVSMAAGVGETPNGMRIGAVYTPPESRGRGYATALVAAVSQHLLDGGRAFTYLYTDLANPTSNSIYQKIGYRPVADPLELRAEAS
jgi:predicted GNAT family acetyltransferase